MGNTCVGPSITKNGFFQSVSTVLWKAPQEGDALPAAPKGPGGGSPGRTPPPALPKPASDVQVAVQSKAPEPVKIATSQSEPAPKPAKQDAKPAAAAAAAATATNPSSNSSGEAPRPRPKVPQVKRVSSAGLLVGSVLKRKTENLKDKYSLGRRLGQGQFGTTYLCVERSTGKEFACKSILKRKLVTDDDVEDVRREQACAAASRPSGSVHLGRAWRPGRAGRAWRPGLRRTSKASTARADARGEHGAGRELPHACCVTELPRTKSLSCRAPRRRALASRDAAQSLPLPTPRRRASSSCRTQASCGRPQSKQEHQQDANNKSSCGPGVSTNQANARRRAQPRSSTSRRRRRRRGPRR